MKCAVQIYMVLGGSMYINQSFSGGLCADLTLLSMGSITVVFYLKGYVYHKNMNEITKY